MHATHSDRGPPTCRTRAKWRPPDRAWYVTSSSIPGGELRRPVGWYSLHLFGSDVFVLRRQTSDCFPRHSGEFRIVGLHSEHTSIAALGRGPFASLFGRLSGVELFACGPF